MDKNGHKGQPRVGGQHLRLLPWKPTSLYPVSHEAKGRLGCNEIPKAWAQGSPFSFMWSPLNTPSFAKPTLLLEACSKAAPPSWDTLGFSST